MAASPLLMLPPSLTSFLGGAAAIRVCGIVLFPTRALRLFMGAMKPMRGCSHDVVHPLGLK